MIGYRRSPEDFCATILAAACPNLLASPYAEGGDGDDYYAYSPEHTPIFAAAVLKLLP